MGRRADLLRAASEAATGARAAEGESWLRIPRPRAAVLQALARHAARRRPCEKRRTHASGAGASAARMHERQRRRQQPQRCHFPARRERETRDAIKVASCLGIKRLDGIRTATHTHQRRSEIRVGAGSCAALENLCDGLSCHPWPAALLLQPAACERTHGTGSVRAGSRTRSGRVGGWAVAHRLHSNPRAVHCSHLPVGVMTHFNRFSWHRSHAFRNLGAGPPHTGTGTGTGVTIDAL